MQHFSFIFTIIIVTSSYTVCNVTNHTKNLDDTLNLEPHNYSSSFLSTKESRKKKMDSPKTVKNTEQIVYLEDVFYSLKSQNWSVEEELCLNDTLRLLRSLQNFTLWAVWNWDAISSEPQGLLFGNRYQLGNFDECMSAPWAPTHADLRTQYCIADIVLEVSQNTVKKRNNVFRPYQSALDFIQYRPPYSRPLNELTWGACVPSSCKPKSVERLLRTMLARSHLGTAGVQPTIKVNEPCQRRDQPRKFDGVFYAFVCVAGLLIANALLCTYVNFRRKECDQNNLKSRIIKAFCMKENAENLLKMKKDGIEVLYGIRFLTICFIVVDHQIGLFNGGPISNGLHVDQDAFSPIGMLLLHDDLFVDTFFLMSGFLTATTLKGFKKFPNPCFIILKRYFRLAIGFAVVIFYICAVYPYTGSGPLWPRAISNETEPCRKNWWLSLLMLNNYIDNENICIVVSWYIPCDFHFFLVTVLLYWVYKRAPQLATTCAGILLIASVLVPGIVNYVNELPAVQLFTYEFIRDPRSSEQFHLTYIKSHARFAAYLVGFCSGYVFAYYKATDNIQRISKKWSIVGTCAGLIVMLVVMITGTTFLWRGYHPLEGAVYAAVNRPVWACGVAALVLCCSLGHVPLLNRFLSWYPWVPLSRLSYGLYLTHTILISRNVFVARNPQHNDYPELLNSAAGVIFWGCCAALIIWLFAEAPANNLLSLCLNYKDRQNKKQEDNANIGANNSRETVPSGSNNYLSENLPPVVFISSKI